MSTLAEIESAVEALPLAQKQELFRRLQNKLQQENAFKQSLPLVPATGRSITQQEIDDASAAD